MLMRYSDDENMILFNRIKDFIGEFMNKIFPYFSCFQRPCLWIFHNSLDGFFNLFLKSNAQSQIFKFIKFYGVFKFKLCKFIEDDFHLYLFPKDLFIGNTLQFSASIGGETFFRLNSPNLVDFLVRFIKAH